MPCVPEGLNERHIYIIYEGNLQIGRMSARLGELPFGSLKGKLFKMHKNAVLKSSNFYENEFIKLLQFWEKCSIMVRLDMR